MDELSFGPSREARRPSRRLRVVAAAVSIAGAAAAGVVFAVTATSAHHATSSQQLAGPPLSRVPSAGCPPGDVTWPSLAGLPAGMRPGALPVIIDAQFSGRCPTP
jgi:hypothetical protein